jgi:hypothetical protein
LKTIDDGLQRLAEKRIELHDALLAAQLEEIDLEQDELNGFEDDEDEILDIK